jgi:hypothetical protein
LNDESGGKKVNWGGTQRNEQDIMALVDVDYCGLIPYSVCPWWLGLICLADSLL